jgi:hypothetical protein
MGKLLVELPCTWGTPAYSSQVALEKTLNTIARGFRGKSVKVLNLFHMIYINIYI